MSDSNFNPDADSSTHPSRKQIVSASHYFVLGDNVTNSRDSREFGAIAHGDIIGVAKFIVWSGTDWNRIGSIR